MIRRALAASARLRSDQRGVSVIELALVAPFLAMMVLGISDLGRGFAARYALQQAAHRTLKFAVLGTTTQDYTFLKAEAATAAGVPVGNVTLLQWLECDGGTAKAMSDTCTGTEQMARYVKLTVTKTFTPLFTNIGYPNRQADGTVLLSANASLRVQ